MARLDPETLETVNRFLDLIRKRYDVAGAILYGSYARGTQTPDSDVDVAILLNDRQGDLYSVMNDMGDVAQDIMIDTDIFISPFPIWMNEWDKPSVHPNPGLLYSIEQEGVPL